MNNRLIERFREAIATAEAPELAIHRAGSARRSLVRVILRRTKYEPPYCEATLIADCSLENAIEIVKMFAASTTQLKIATLSEV